MTGVRLAEAGEDVLVVEEGRHHHVDSSPDHTVLDETECPTVGAAAQYYLENGFELA